MTTREGMPTINDASMRAVLDAMVAHLDRIAAAVASDARCPSPLHVTRQATVRPIIGATLITAARGWRAIDDPAGDIIEVLLVCRVADIGYVEACVATDAGAELVETVRHPLPVRDAAKWAPEAMGLVDREAQRLLGAITAIIDELNRITSLR